MKMAWVEIEGRQHRFNMPCFICCRAGRWPALHISADLQRHGFTITVCSEECLAMTEIVLLGMTYKDLSDKVIMHRNTYLNSDYTHDDNI